MSLPLATRSWVGSEGAWLAADKSKLCLAVARAPLPRRVCRIRLSAGACVLHLVPGVAGKPAGQILLPSQC